VPAGAGRLTVRVWDRFGDLVATPVDQMKPPAGQRTIEWERGQRDPGHFILRVTVDNVSESHIVHVGPVVTAATPGLLNMPAELDGIITGIHGLDNRKVMKKLLAALMALA